MVGNGDRAPHGTIVTPIVSGDKVSEQPDAEDVDASLSLAGEDEPTSEHSPVMAAGAVESQPEVDFKPTVEQEDFGDPAQISAPQNNGGVAVGVSSSDENFAPDEEAMVDSEPVAQESGEVETNELGSGTGECPSTDDTDGARESNSEQADVETEAGTMDAATADADVVEALTTGDEPADQ